MVLLGILQGGNAAGLTGQGAATASSPRADVAVRPETPNASSAPPPAPSQADTGNGHIPTAAEMEQMSADLQAALDAASKEPLTVTFFKDERWPGFVIQLRDRDGEVVRQFPAEKVLNLRGIMDELAGMVVDEMT